MGRPAIDETGNRYGQLEVVERTPSNKRGEACWKCQCNCGETTIVCGSDLRSGNTGSCGCYLRDQHRKKSPHWVPTCVSGEWQEYPTWRNMVQRCTNPKSSSYAHYGGRDISVAKEWLPDQPKGRFSGYTQFMCDMGPRPEGYLLDRKDANGDYTPDNCWWVPAWMQKANKRSTRKLLATAYDRDKTLKWLVNALNIDVEAEAA